MAVPQPLGDRAEWAGCWRPFALSKPAARRSNMSRCAEPHSPLAETLQLYAWQGPKPSRWTVQFLRQHDLLNKERWNACWVIHDVARIHRSDRTPESCYALAELSLIAGRRMELQDPQEAQGHYWDCLVHSYEYLFDPQYERVRTPYDPQFRSTCDLYNGSLESWMRLAQKAGTLKAGASIPIATREGNCNVTVNSCGSVWKAEDFERFEFASDYEVTGLANLDVTHGLGVPLIAVRRPGTAPPEVEKYYAKGLSFPMTALLRPVSTESTGAAPHRIGSTFTTRSKSAIRTWPDIRCRWRATSRRRWPISSTIRGFKNSTRSGCYFPGKKQRSPGCTWCSRISRRRFPS